MGTQTAPAQFAVVADAGAIKNREHDRRAGRLAAAIENSRGSAPRPKPNWRTRWAKILRSRP